MPVVEAPYVTVNGQEMLAYAFLKYSDRNNYTCKPNTPFAATVEVKHAAGSAVIVEDIQTNTLYQILNSYLVELIKRDLIHNAQITGTWTVYKHGQSYAIKLL
jgi:hypothetical protein